MNATMIATVACLMLVSTNAFAEEDSALSSNVQFSDLNLGSIAGRAQLNERMQVAIRAVCPADRFSGVQGIAPLKQCKDEAQASVASSVRLAMTQAASRSLQLANADGVH